MKKLVSMFLTLALVLSMAVPAMAEGGSYTITIKNAQAGHQYEAYQIFTGDFKEESTTPPTWKISNAQWGNGVDAADADAALGTAASVAERLVSTTAVKTFAVHVQSYLNDANKKTSGAYDATNKSYTITVDGPGYYLIQDAKQTGSAEGFAYTAYITQVVTKDTVLEPKASVPTSEKKVADINDSTSAAKLFSDWQDSADYDIGDAVPFQLTGTLPENFGEYTEYKMIFHDKQSECLTFNADSVKVYVKHLENTVEVKSGYEVKTSGLAHSDCTFEIVMDDVRKLTDENGVHIAVTKNSIIHVEYTSTLNKDAEIGSLGNPNTMYMEYSNNPNNEAAGETGSTKEDTVIVFTYQTIVNKVDGNKNPLEGADFDLYKRDADGNWVKLVDTNQAEQNPTDSVIIEKTAKTFAFKGLDDGFYMLREEVTPDGYNTIDDIFFEIIATHDVTSEDPQLTGLSSPQINEDGSLVQKITFSARINEQAGSITSDIVNKAGATLPQTGGMGTTLFYIAGAILVIGAGVTLIARKRMNK